MAKKTQSPKPAKQYGSESALKTMAKMCEGAHGTWGLEQNDYLATISEVPEIQGRRLVLEAHAIGLVNALWDERRKRVAIPVASFYPDHEIAAAAKTQLAALEKIGE